MNEHETPLTTVVVPTRDRPRALARCLGALERQTLAQLEIVVVDDGSVDPGEVESVVDGSERVRLVRLSGRGPAAARNAGAEHGRGDVVCFVDDDCEPEPRWAELLTAAVRAAGGPAAGRIRNGLWDSHLAEASQAIVEHLQLGGLTPGGRLAFAPSSNLACSAQLARDLPFDESYPLAAGEDREWTRRASRLGHAPTYVPEAVVIHRHQLTPAGFLRQHFGYGRGAARLARDLEGRAALLGPRARLGLIGHSLRRGPAVAALVSVAQLVTAAGFALELAKLRLGGAER